MNPERARQLLGGLAAGILTPEERETLFEAALQDQALFNEVADELEFAVFLQSAGTRAQLANRIEVEPERRKWWALRPAWLALSGVLAASIVLFIAIRSGPSYLAPAPVTEAQRPVPLAPPVVESAKKEPAPAAAKPVVHLQAEAKPATVAATADEVAKTTPPESSPAAPSQRATATAVPPAGVAGGAMGGMTARAMAPRAAAPPVPAPASPAYRPSAGLALMEQTTGASLTGTVHDESGAVVRDAKVDIVNNATNGVLHAATDASGRFVALSLPPGPYTVTANVPGFVQERRSLMIEGNQPVQIDIPLRVGNVASTVIVNSQAPVLPLVPSLTQVAVLDFANGNPQSESGAQVANQLSNQLLNSGQFGVIDRDKVQQAAQSQNAVGRAPSAQEAAALGRSIGADAVIVGSVQAPGGNGKDARNVSVMAQIIDTKKAKPVVNISADAASLQGATNILGDKIQSQLAKPVEGKVTRRTGDIVSVLFTEPTAVQAGGRCEVIRGTRKIGELVITSVNGLSAFGKFSGSSRPRVGDRVTSPR